MGRHSAGFMVPFAGFGKNFVDFGASGPFPPPARDPDRDRRGESRTLGFVDKNRVRNFESNMFTVFARIDHGDKELSLYRRFRKGCGFFRGVWVQDMEWTLSEKKEEEYTD